MDAWCQAVRQIDTAQHNIASASEQYHFSGVRNVHPCAQSRTDQPRIGASTVNDCRDALKAFHTREILEDFSQGCTATFLENTRKRHMSRCDARRHRK